MIAWKDTNNFTRKWKEREMNMIAELRFGNQKRENWFWKPGEEIKREKCYVEIETC